MSAHANYCKQKLKQSQTKSNSVWNGLKTIISNPSLSSSFGLLTYAADHDLQLDENHDQNSQKKSFFSYIYNFFASI